MLPFLPQVTIMPRNRISSIKSNKVNINLWKERNGNRVNSTITKLTYLWAK